MQDGLVMIISQDSIVECEQGIGEPSGPVSSTSTSTNRAEPSVASSHLTLPSLTSESTSPPSSLLTTNQGVLPSPPFALTINLQVGDDSRLGSMTMGCGWDEVGGGFGRICGSRTVDLMEDVL